MEFSPVYKCSIKEVALSPDGKFIANANDYRVIVRRSFSQKVLSVYKCRDIVEKIVWSPTSQHFFVIPWNLVSPIIEIWSILDPQWSCIIEDLTFLIENAIWLSDGKHLVLFGQNGTRVTLWNLKRLTCHVIGSVRKSMQPLAIANSTLFAICIITEKYSSDCILFFRYKNNEWILETSITADTNNLESIYWKKGEGKEALNLVCVDNIFSGSVSILDYKGNQISKGLLNSGNQISSDVFVGSINDPFIYCIYENFIIIVECIGLNHLGRISLDLRESLVLFSNNTTDCYLKNPDIGKIQHLIPTELLKYISLIDYSKSKISNNRHHKVNICVSLKTNRFAINSHFWPTAIFVWSLEDFSLISVIYMDDKISCFSWRPDGKVLGILTISGKSFVTWRLGGCLHFEIPETHQLVQHDSIFQWIDDYTICFNNRKLIYVVKLSQLE